MNTNTTLVAQHAKASWPISLGLATVVSIFSALLLQPLISDPSKTHWLALLIPLLMLLIHTSYGIKSWIVLNGNNLASLKLRTQNATIASELPCRQILHVERCAYHRGRSPKPAAFIDDPYHRVFTQLGYSGPGLIVRYVIPAAAGGDGIPRGWQFPAPEADAFEAELLQYSKTNP